MSEKSQLLERLRKILGLGGDGKPEPEVPTPPHAGGLPPGCEEAAEIPCEEAARRVFEYLDGELPEGEAEAIRCHVAQCRRCYPMYNWERMFLDVLGERGGRPEPSGELRKRVGTLLDSEMG